MTGFGSGSVERGGIAVRAEVRSVNHRFLQVKVRVPVELSDAEGALEALVRRRVERGSVNATLRLEAAGGLPPVGLDAPLARRYAELLRGLGRELGIGQDLSLERLAMLPGVLGSRAQALEPAALQAAAEEALDAAVAGLLAMREREGLALAEDLGKHLEALSELGARMRARMPQVVRALFEAQQRRLAELLGPERPVNEADLARELALLADRTDVSEEFARLDSHVAQCGELIAAGGPVGRRLDFLTQELLRELNTVASKCQDAGVAQWVVEAKAIVERLREQVANAE